MTEIGRVLLFVGIFLVIVGVVFTFSSKIPLIGRLPGDIYIEKEKFTFYFPIVTSILLSIIFTIILNLFLRR